MPLIRRASADEAAEAFYEEVQARAQIAFAAGCRLAIHSGRCAAGCCIGYDFVVLLPGEKAPAGWTLYEERDGRAVGRSV